MPRAMTEDQAKQAVDSHIADACAMFRYWTRQAGSEHTTRLGNLLGDLPRPLFNRAAHVARLDTLSNAIADAVADAFFAGHACGVVHGLRADRPTDATEPHSTDAPSCPPPSTT